MNDIIKEEIDSGEWAKVKDEEELNNLCNCPPFHHCHKHHISKKDMIKDAIKKEKIVEELTKDTSNVTHEALRRYFVRLSQYGYYDYNSVYRLLALTVIANFRKEFSCYWNKEDESIIEKVLNCLYCSICAIPRPDRIVETELTHTGNTRKDYINYYGNDFTGSYSDL